jgi:tRNA A37 threonylcarbamoyladenosine biosynthesis protein TsaE
MSTLVGREDALSATSRFLHASPPDPQVFVLEGEAGIGKTTVWRAAGTLAEDRG